MKRILILAAALLAMALPSRADDAATLRAIEKANVDVTTIEANFTHRYSKGNKSKDFAGTCYFSAPGSLAMAYTVDTEALIINAGRLYARRDKKVTKGDTHNGQVRSLTTTLINCIKGRILTVAEDNNAEWSLMEAGGNYVVTLTARKKASKGYSKITLKYRKSDCLITGLSLEEFNGAVNTYVLSSLRTGETIPPAVFNIPK